MNTITTYADAAEATATQVPPHLEAAARIPEATPTLNQQGDVYFAPHDGPLPDTAPVDLASGPVKVVQGDADRNSHILAGRGVWYPGTVTDELADYGLLVVSGGGAVALTHTEQHGAILVPAGVWRFWGQVSYEAELRRAAD